MYITGVLSDNRVLAEEIHMLTFKLKRRFPKEPKPGNYVMLWLPGSGEIPLSIYDYDTDVFEASFIVEGVGPTTRALNTLKPGDKVGVRGPYGNSFSIEGYRSYLLVAGGIGAPPIIYALKRIRGKKVYLFGARTASKVFMVNELRSAGYEVYVSTDDGTLGFKGYVTDLAELVVSGGRRFDIILACGPDLMLKKLYRFAEKYNMKFEASFTRIVKCGVGICGSCVLEPLGLRVCVDGPVFQGEQLGGLWDG